MTTSAEVLLKLLDKVPDADTLETLLEPRNLLLLLQRSGRNAEDVRQALKNGTLPGELLLQLLEEGADGDMLIAQLGDPTADTDAADFPPVSVFGVTSSSSGEAGLKRKNDDALAATSDSGENLFGENHQAAMTLIGAFSVIFPALILANFIPFVHLTPVIATLIAVIGGTAAGAVSKPSTLFYPRGAIVGFVYGIGALWATIYYLRLRDSIFYVELAIPVLIGSIPAMIVYGLLIGLPRSRSNA